MAIFNKYLQGGDAGKSMYQHLVAFSKWLSKGDPEGSPSRQLGQRDFKRSRNG